MNKGFLSLISVFGLVSLSACSDYRKQEDRVLTVEVEDSSSQSESEEVSTGGALEKIAFILDLFSKDGELSESELSHILNKFKGELQQLLSGQQISLEQVMETFFSLDVRGDNNGKTSTSEIAQGLEDALPTLRWYQGDQALDAKDLRKRLKKEYPTATDPAISGLLQTLMRVEAVRGNKDGSLELKELDKASLVLAVVDASNPLEAMANAAKDSEKVRMGMDLLTQKLDRQVYARYPGVVGHGDLSEIDLKLEVMSFALNFYVLEEIAHMYGGDIAPSYQGDAFVEFGIPIEEAERLKAVRVVYASVDSMGKPTDPDQYWMSTLESFAYVSDVDYAGRVLEQLGSQRAKGVCAQVETPECQHLLEHLRLTYPRVGTELFSAKAPMLHEFYAQYDQPKMAGNPDGNIDRGELTLALSDVFLLDQAFLRYDKDENSLLDHAETLGLMQDLGYLSRDPSQEGKNQTVIKVIFSDFEFDGQEPDGLDAFLHFMSELVRGSSEKPFMSPREFYPRVLHFLSKTRSHL